MNILYIRQILEKFQKKSKIEYQTLVTMECTFVNHLSVIELIYFQISLF